MNYIFLILCTILLPIISVKQTKPKLCINCKHFISDNHNDVYSRCSLFVREDNIIPFLVNGIKNEEKKHHYCSVARGADSLCGKEGKHYKKKRVKKIL